MTALNNRTKDQLIALVFELQRDVARLTAAESSRRAGIINRAADNARRECATEIRDLEVRLNRACVGWRDAEERLLHLSPKSYVEHYNSAMQHLKACREPAI